MATVAQIIPQLEGMVGVVGDGNNALATWLECVKAYLRSPSCRDLTDLEFKYTASVTDVGIPVDASATHLLAAVVEISGDLGTDTSGFVGYTDADTDTIDLTAALPEDVVAVIPVNDLAVSTVSEFYPVIFFAGASGIEAAPGSYGETGISLTTGLTAWADGMDGNAITAASCRVFTLYRT